MLLDLRDTDFLTVIVPLLRRLVYRNQLEFDSLRKQYLGVVVKHAPEAKEIECAVQLAHADPKYKEGSKLPVDLELVSESRAFWALLDVKPIEH